MINKRSVMLILAFAICFHSHLSFGYGLEAKVTAKVVNEEGKPMSGEEIYIGFEGPGGGGEGVKGLTDMNGYFTATGKTIRSVSFMVRKTGYYQTYTEYDFTRTESGILKSTRWLPWNPEVTLVMRKIENPVAMYARDMTKSGSIKIPVVGKEVGFDLIEYDWVDPFGKGKQADFIFKLDSTVKSQDEYDGTLTLTFSNKYDGIQIVKEDREYGSRFKLPRLAPENGYQKKLAKHNKSLPGKPYEEDFKKDNNYIFRIRSEEKDGKLIRAMYGKIQGEIRFGAREARIGFKYYLNLDYTRNLEFDPKQNLFKNLKSTDEVGLE